MSFTDRLRAAFIPASYGELGRNPASGFGFMAFILFIVMTISCVVNTITFSRDLGGAVEDLHKVPEFSVVNGKVEYQGEMPVVMKDENSIFILDTTGQTGPDAIRDYPTGFLVTHDRLYQQQGGRYQEYDLSRDLPITLTKSDVVGFLGALWVVVPIAYVFMFLFQLGFKALDACILGLVALIWGSATNRKVDFGLGFKLGLYAMTVPMILQWVVPNYTTIPFGSWKGNLGFVAWWAVAIIYLIYGLQAYYRTHDNDGQGYYAGNP